ncbi:glutathione S-transferase family protein [Methylobacterium currus]|uniref:glutathione S-transferase family protein n=1 Tax=Methylobacterium currus TaxID=2051553 RepID=UPI0013E02AC7|nr:glutathione binding-like protein [Methylobacterium currus]
MIFYDAKQPGPNPTTVRLFVLERGGLSFDVETIDLAALENRRRPYLENVNARGELPALRLDDGRVITEITAICGYFDEIAQGGRHLCGNSPVERAEVHMWTRRMYLEIISHFVAWFRGSDIAVEAYRGNRILQLEAMHSNRLIAERGLNMLDDEMAEKAFIAGENLSMADIILYGFMAAAGPETPWLNVPQRPSVGGWYDRMSARPAAKQMLKPFGSRVELAAQ